METSFARSQAKAVKGAADCGWMVGGRSHDSGSGETLYPAKQVKVQIRSLTPAGGHREFCTRSDRPSLVLSFHKNQYIEKMYQIYKSVRSGKSVRTIC